MRRPVLRRWSDWLSRVFCVVRMRCAMMDDTLVLIRLMAYASKGGTRRPAEIIRPAGAGVLLPISCHDGSCDRL
jgi:hypothetical protein